MSSSVSSLKTRRNQRPMSIGGIRRAAMSLIEPRSGSENDDVAKPVVEERPKKKKDMRKICGDFEAKLPEKYELLDAFFNSLDSSIRLLQIKRKPTTFSNINDQIESLTKRRFLQGHLAQLKFIVPEAIVIKKILQRDEHTHCMRPDLSITLDVEAIENIKSKRESCRHSELRKVFRSRLFDFIKSHPEGDDVPEEVLPETSNRSKHIPDENSVRSFNENPNVIEPLQQTASASHLPRSFKRSFSLLHPKSSVDNANQYQPITSVHVSDDSKPTTEYVCDLSLNPSPEKGSIVSASPPFPETPLKSVICFEDQSSGSDKSASLLKTPLELASTPAKLMSSRAILNTPKRSDKIPHDDNSLTSPRKLLRRPPANRPLKFDTPVSKKRDSSSDGDIYEILDEDLVQSIQEKERKALIERDPAISQAKNRQKMISTLPKMFDMIRFFFQSIKRTVVSKEKLLDTMITGNSVIRDRTEVVEQLKLLQELVPEWIHEKSASSGEVIVCVNKDSSPEVIRTRLAEAK